MLPTRPSSPVPSSNSARRHGGLDLMVNNAGVAVAGIRRGNAGRRLALDRTSSTCWAWCGAAGRHCRCHEAGRVSGLLLNIASSAGFAAAPQMAAVQLDRRRRDLAAARHWRRNWRARDPGFRARCRVFSAPTCSTTMRAPRTKIALAHQLMDRSGHDPVGGGRGDPGRGGRAANSTSSGRRSTAWPGA